MRLNYSALLTKKEIELIHSNSLALLQNTGIVVHSKEARNIFTQHGASCTGQKIFIPEKLIEKSLATVPKTFVLNNGHRKIRIGHGSLCTMPGYGATHVRKQSLKSTATTRDFIQFSKLNHSNDLIQMACPYTIEPADVPIDLRERFKMVTSLRYSDKPTFSITQNAQTATESIQFVKTFFSDDQHYIVLGNVNISAPLIMGKNTSDVITVHANENQPLMIACGSGLSGLTAPPTPAANLLLNNAAVLSGITLSQMIHPGLPVVYGFPLFAINPIHATIACGHPYTGLFSMAAAEMGRFYKIPVRSGGIYTDASQLNYQSGFESALNSFSSLYSKVDCLMHTFGMEESLNTINYDKYFLDESMFSQLIDYLHGFEINDVTLMLDEIMRSGSDGNFISMRNLRLIRKQYKTWPFPDAPEELYRHTQQLLKKRLEIYNPPDYDCDQLAMLNQLIPENLFE